MREAEIDELVELDVMEEMAGAKDRIAYARDLIARCDEAIGQVRDRLSDELAKQLMAEADLADAEAAYALSDTDKEEFTPDKWQRGRRLDAFPETDCVEVILVERQRVGHLRHAVTRDRVRLEEINFRRTQAKACIAFIER